MTEPANWYRSRPPADRRDGRTAVIFDLDGVISDASHRQHYLRRRRPDWRGFFMAAKYDPALPVGLGLAASMGAIPAASERRSDHSFIICTARPHYLIGITRRWLAAHDIRPDLLIIRPHRDRRSSEGFKRHELRRLREAGYQITLAIDDDERIIAMYRDEGVFALYRHSGYYDNR